MTNSKQYEGPERRAFSRNVDEVEITFDRKLRDHEDREEERTREIISAMFATAFPDGVHKHYDYHQAKINAAKEEAEFWKAAKMELTKVGVSVLVGVVKAVLILALVGLLYKLGLGSVATDIVK